jgi:hypothetical protein
VKRHTSDNFVTLVFGATVTMRTTSPTPTAGSAAKNVGLDDVLTRSQNAVMLWHNHWSQPDRRPDLKAASSSALFGEEAPEPVEEDDEQHDLPARSAIVTPAISWSASGLSPQMRRETCARRTGTRASAAARAAGRAARRTRTREGVRRARAGGEAAAARSGRAATRRGSRCRSSRRARCGSATPGGERRVVDGRHVPGEVVAEPDRQRDGGCTRSRHGRKRASACAIAPEMPSTARSGAHSARITFCSRCAVSR